MIFNDDELYTSKEVAAGLKVHVASVRQSVRGLKNKRPKLGRWLPDSERLGSRRRWYGWQIKGFMAVPGSGVLRASLPASETVPPVPVSKRKPGRPRKASVGGGAA